MLNPILLELALTKSSADKKNSPQQPPNYRLAFGEVNKCASCKNFVQGHCKKFNIGVEPDGVCDAFEPKDMQLPPPVAISPGAGVTDVAAPIAAGMGTEVKMSSDGKDSIAPMIDHGPVVAAPLKHDNDRASSGSPNPSLDESVKNQDRRPHEYMEEAEGDVNNNPRATATLFGVAAKAAGARRTIKRAAMPNPTINPAGLQPKMPHVMQNAAQGVTLPQARPLVGAQPGDPSMNPGPPAGPKGTPSTPPPQGSQAAPSDPGAQQAAPQPPAPQAQPAFKPSPLVALYGQEPSVSTYAKFVPPAPLPDNMGKMAVQLPIESLAAVAAAVKMAANEPLAPSKPKAPTPPVPPSRPKVLKPPMPKKASVLQIRQAGTGTAQDADMCKSSAQQISKSPEVVSGAAVVTITKSGCHITKSSSHKNKVTPTLLPDVSDAHDLQKAASRKGLWRKVAAMTMASTPFDPLSHDLTSHADPKSLLSRGGLGAPTTEQHDMMNRLVGPGHHPGIRGRDPGRSSGYLDPATLSQVRDATAGARTAMDVGSAPAAKSFFDPERFQTLAQMASVGDSRAYAQMQQMTDALNETVSDPYTARMARIRMQDLALQHPQFNKTSMAGRLGRLASRNLLTKSAQEPQQQGMLSRAGGWLGNQARGLMQRGQQAVSGAQQGVQDFHRSFDPQGFEEQQRQQATDKALEKSRARQLQKQQVAERQDRREAPERARQEALAKPYDPSTMGGSFGGGTQQMQQPDQSGFNAPNKEMNMGTGITGGTQGPGEVIQAPQQPQPQPQKPAGPDPQLMAKWRASGARIPFNRWAQSWEQSGQKVEQAAQARQQHGYQSPMAKYQGQQPAAQPQQATPPAAPAPSMAQQAQVAGVQSAPQSTTPAAAPQPAPNMSGGMSGGAAPAAAPAAGFGIKPQSGTPASTPAPAAPTTAQAPAPAAPAPSQPLAQAKTPAVTGGGKTPPHEPSGSGTTSFT